MARDKFEVVSPAHEAALIAKLNAETQELLLQKELRSAELREKSADATIREIALAARQREEDLTLVQDHYVFHHFFAGAVDFKNVYTALAVLAAWHRQDPVCPMNITIDSEGGSVIDGMHLFDQLTAYSIRGGGRHEVTITVRGQAASMGAILVQAADRRVIGPESYLLVHELAASARGKLGDIKDSLKFYEKISNRIANLFVERSGGKIDVETFAEKWSRTDWWLSSDEALELGFVDEIG